MLTQESNGIFPISPTPFATDGSIDYNSLDSLVDFYSAGGMNGITILGRLGEASKLTHAESFSIVKRVLERSTIDVVVGVTSPGFSQMRDLAAFAMDNGAAGVMVGPSPSLRTNEMIIDYFENVANALGTETPLVLQDYPLAFGVQISVKTLCSIASRIDNTLILKHEDWPGLEKISSIRALQASGKLRPFPILVGNGGLFYDFELERGVDGAMTGYSYPELLSGALSMRDANDQRGLHTLFNRHLPLIRYEQQPGLGLAVRKYVYMKRAIIASDTRRAPTRDLSDTTTKEIDYMISTIRVD